MLRIRELIMILITGIALCALAGCQNNAVNKPGYAPRNCAMPGSSCSGR